MRAMTNMNCFRVGTLKTNSEAETRIKEFIGRNFWDNIGKGIGNKIGQREKLSSITQQKFKICPWEVLELECHFRIVLNFATHFNRPSIFSPLLTSVWIEAFSEEDVQL